MTLRPPKTRLAPPRFFGYYPGTVAVVTAAHGSRRNVLSVGWHAALSMSPPLYGIAVNPHHATHPLIVGSGSFAINFLPFELSEVIAGVGTLSLHDGIDKFAHFQLAVEAPLTTTAPILAAAYLSYECALRDTVRTGDHDWLVGEVTAVHYRTDAFDDRLVLDSRQVTPAIYYGRAEYAPLPHQPRRAFPPAYFTAPARGAG